ncbi:MAG: hypothetical protein WC794_01390 [Candidatus Doudnabacteria bacterium]|jgi:hypothetical protein
MSERDIGEHWGFKDEQNTRHKEKGVRGGVESLTPPDLVVNYNLDSGQEITEPYCKELLEVILTTAGVTMNDDMGLIINKLRSGGLTKFESATAHSVSFFDGIPARGGIKVNVLEPRNGSRKDVISLPIFLFYKGKKVALFINSNRDGLLRYLREGKSNERI